MSRLTLFSKFLVILNPSRARVPETQSRLVALTLPTKPLEGLSTGIVGSVLIGFRSTGSSRRDFDALTRKRIYPLDSALLAVLSCEC